MTQKCEICKNKIEETFLGKLKGTIIKTRKGKKNELHYVCNECQRKHKNIKEQLK